MENLKASATFDQLQKRREDILRLAQKHGVTNVRVFGSLARGEARPDSDVDLLVEAPAGTSIWAVVGLWQELAQLLGTEVSVVTEATLEGDFKRNVLKDAIPL